MPNQVLVQSPLPRWTHVTAEATTKICTAADCMQDDVIEIVFDKQKRYK